MTEFLRNILEFDRGALRRGGIVARPNKRDERWECLARSQHLMQRLILQFVAIVIVMLTIWLMVGM
jgi:hypothetical protein